MCIKGNDRLFPRQEVPTSVDIIMYVEFMDLAVFSLDYLHEFINIYVCSLSLYSVNP